MREGYTVDQYEAYIEGFNAGLDRYKLELENMDQSFKLMLQKGIAEGRDEAWGAARELIANEFWTMSNYARAVFGSRNPFSFSASDVSLIGMPMKNPLNVSEMYFAKFTAIRLSGFQRGLLSA